MTTILLVIHVFLAIGLVIVILLQRSEGGALGIGGSGGGGGGAGGMMSTRSQANLLTRTTSILAGLFIVTSLTLAILAGHDRKPHSVLDSAPVQSAPASQAPASGTAPGQDKGQGQAPAGSSSGQTQTPAQPAAPLGR